MSFIEVKNLRKTYQSGEETVAAVDGLSFEVELGEFMAITGPSGSGKSTLLSLIGGLMHPSDGAIIIDEIDLFQLTTEQLADFRREYIGFVFQSFHLIPYLNVIENAMLPLTVMPFSRAEKMDMAMTMLEKVGLANKAHRLPDELSGGEQERVAIARALVNHPPIILADEPTGNLDSATSEEIMKLFQQLNREGQTIIMVTHNPENLIYAHRSLHMTDGKRIRINETPLQGAIDMNA
jgi:putative ABC transport system ATP-binding protein